MQRETIKTIICLIIIIPGSFLIFLFLLAHPVGEGSVDTCNIEIEYLDSRRNENISCTDIIFEGMAFPVRFELNPERTYEVWYKEKDATNIIELEHNTTEKTIVFQFEKEGLIGLVGWPVDICFNNHIANIYVKST